MTVDELDERMSAAELDDWRAFDRVEPIGDDRLDLLAGVILANLARMLGSTERLQPGDFMPVYHKVRLSQTELRRKIDFTLKAFNVCQPSPRSP